MPCLRCLTTPSRRTALVALSIGLLALFATLISVLMVARSIVPTRPWPPVSVAACLNTPLATVYGIGCTVAALSFTVSLLGVHRWLGSVRRALAAGVAPRGRALPCGGKAASLSDEEDEDTPEAHSGRTSVSKLFISTALLALFSFWLQGVVPMGSSQFCLATARTNATLNIFSNADEGATRSTNTAGTTTTDSNKDSNKDSNSVNTLPLLVGKDLYQSWIHQGALGCFMFLFTPLHLLSLLMLVLCDDHVRRAFGSVSILFKGAVLLAAFVSFILVVASMGKTATAESRGEIAAGDASGPLQSLFVGGIFVFFASYAFELWALGGTRRGRRGGGGERGGGGGADDDSAIPMANMVPAGREGGDVREVREVDVIVDLT